MQGTARSNNEITSEFTQSIKTDQLGLPNCMQKWPKKHENPFIKS